ncbi:hypothetical protein [Pedobacter paludis]|uniref:Uncharacterized protein n=1 Tax=Pedobacter paludis TaxID=2203212 RepID=A0A317F492_9SPHI|nr:hypothetical protein [Pedobacter paludis]PWS33153.1 hypothetical protein DF947_00510 [Pedobacter paludis]
MIIVDENVPTSNLLEIKVGDQINNEGKSGAVEIINLHETDEYLLFLFGLTNGLEIEIKKLKQVC